MLHAIPPTVPAIVAPIADGRRDEFPKCRVYLGPDGPVHTCPKAQTRLYWLTLTRATVDPELGATTEETVVDAEITAGFIPGEGGEVARLALLVAAEMPGWTITGLQLADEPDEEF